MRISEKKSLNAILFFALKSTNGRINRLKLMKLLWLSDRIHLNRYGRLILVDQYSALPHGPIPSNTLNTSQSSAGGYFNVEGHAIIAEGDFNGEYFSKSDLEIMEYVWAEYGKITGPRLRDLSHFFPEWLRFEKDLTDKNAPKSYPIVLDDFFTPPNQGVQYRYNKEESEISKSKFHAHSTILHALTK